MKPSKTWGKKTEDKKKESEKKIKTREKKNKGVQSKRVACAQRVAYRLDWLERKGRIGADDLVRQVRPSRQKESYKGTTIRTPSKLQQRYNNDTTEELPHIHTLSPFALSSWLIVGTYTSRRSLTNPEARYQQIHASADLPQNVVDKNPQP